MVDTAKRNISSSKILGVLKAKKENPELTPTRLAERFNLNRSTVSRFLKGDFPKWFIVDQAIKGKGDHNGSR